MASRNRLNTYIQASNSKNEAANLNYLVSLGEDGKPNIARTEPPLGFQTLTAAKEAKIEEIQNDIRGYRERMNSYLDELEEATKGRALQDDVRSYLGAITDYQGDIVEAKKEQMNVRKLKKT